MIPLPLSLLYFISLVPTDGIWYYNMVDPIKDQNESLVLSSYQIDVVILQLCPTCIYSIHNSSHLIALSTPSNPTRQSYLPSNSCYSVYQSSTWSIFPYLIPKLQCRLFLVWTVRALWCIGREYNGELSPWWSSCHSACRWLADFPDDILAMLSIEYPSGARAVLSSMLALTRHSVT